jgi:alpha-tubulin suppressor-like RCC1 family protein
VAIGDGGVLWSWGKGTYGQLGSGGTSNRLTAQTVAGLEPVAHIAGGTEHTLGVLSAGP